MIHLDYRDSRPIYEQVKDSLRRLIVSGALPPDEKLPSVRELACELGQPGASRAIGGAVGRNPLSVIIPCHRVVGHDGRLTGYAGGLDL